MKIKILEKSRWAQRPDQPQLEFNKDQIVDVDNDLAQIIINAGFGVEVVEPELKMVEQEPENKMLEPEYQNKSQDNPKKKNKG